MDNANANVTAASIPVLIFEAKASFIQSFLLAFGTNLLKNINITIVGTHDSSIVPKVMTISFLDNITPELEHRKSGYVERKRRPYQGNVVRIA